MSKKVKIVVAGIGGVGGYFGGLLAKKYENSNEVEICFLARGEHLRQIRKNGLKVIKGSTEFIAKPALATDNANEFGIADYILICTKGYDLDTTIEQLRPCMDENTILLPLLNGMESVERIKIILPETTVLEGCVYIVSALKEAGVIENSGNSQTLSFGLDNESNERLLFLEKLFTNAGIDTVLSEKISSITWEKFIFIAAVGTATSYFNCNIGQILEKNEDTLSRLINEVTAIAKAKKIAVDPQIASKTMNKLKALRPETSSSMHRDFKNRKHHTELETLTGYVVRAGQKFGIETPEFTRAYNQLISRSSHH
jgi:2-dehydropantoate 2-reductase